MIAQLIVTSPSSPVDRIAGRVTTVHSLRPHPAAAAAERETGSQSLLRRRCTYTHPTPVEHSTQTFVVL